MFVQADLESILQYLNRLTPETKPSWGTMSAQRMVEHLTDALRVANGKNPQSVATPEDKLEKMLLFLESDQPMPQNVPIPFTTPDENIRHEELELAIDEFVEEWLEFEELYATEPGRTEIHPTFGPLNHAQWKRLAEKHHTHHFTQFGLL
jgi:hypothetical protein